MTKKNNTQDHIKEIRAIRREMSKRYWKDPSSYMAQMFEKQKEWASYVSKTKKIVMP